MTTLSEALTEFGTTQLAAFITACAYERERATEGNDRAWSAFNRALLIAALDEQRARERADTSLFDYLAPNPFKVIDTTRP